MTEVRHVIYKNQLRKQIQDVNLRTMLSGHNCPLGSSIDCFPVNDPIIYLLSLSRFMKVKSESEVTQSCPTPSDRMTAAYQAPPSMGFSRQEYWSGLPLPSPASSLAVSLT